MSGINRPDPQTVTICLTQVDAYRLLWLTKNAAAGKVWDDYWAGLTHQIRQQLDDHETDADNAFIGITKNLPALP